MSTTTTRAHSKSFKSRNAPTPFFWLFLSPFLQPSLLIFILSNSIEFLFLSRFISRQHDHRKLSKQGKELVRLLAPHSNTTLSSARGKKESRTLWFLHDGSQHSFVHFLPRHQGPSLRECGDAAEAPQNWLDFVIILDDISCEFSSGSGRLAPAATIAGNACSRGE